MRAPADVAARWQATSDRAADLRQAVRDGGPAGPCVSGCRSVCWKTFLLSADPSRTELARVLSRGRQDFTRKRAHFLNLIHHPEALAQLSADPLADDPESPWNTVRADEAMRAEIRQDVQRLPDEANYHHDQVQAMILDILFIYCKANPSRGGYRQGMHELLAPIVHVVEQDAVDGSAAGAESPARDRQMRDIVDSSYVEHDSYLLFSCLMEHAQSFYEVHDSGDPALGTETGRQESTSAIVKRSEFIHDVCLRSLDPELASHLTNMEILPQIFLIRWIRLLFSREFPLDQVLVLWDSIFAQDASLELIDLICCAMLIRIRHQLLEADYPACLVLLLKYPPPASAHGPHTFVDDALYLRHHLDTAGRDALVIKYTGKAPTTSGAPDSPGAPRTNRARLRGFGGRSPVPSPSRFLPQQGGVESLIQGAAKSAKGVLERGERLGLNQAVRDAMVEFRRNMQTFNESRRPARAVISVGSEGAAAEALEAMERRNKQLASLLDEAVDNVKTAAATSPDDRVRSINLMEVAVAKVQFVQVYLRDTSLDVMATVSPAVKDSGIESRADGAVETAKQESLGGAQARVEVGTPDPQACVAAQEQGAVAEEEEEEEEPERRPPATKDQGACHGQEVGSREAGPPAARPAAPMPTRSALAQSSFSWMLEPGESSGSQALPSASQAPKAAQHHKKRASGNVSRERNAFLFGEEAAAESMSMEASNGDEIFGLETIRKPRRRT